MMVLLLGGTSLAMAAASERQAVERHGHTSHGGDLQGEHLQGQHRHGQHPHPRHPHGQHAGTDEADPELQAQIGAVRAATERYRDHSVAVADGYELFGQDGPLMGEHWYRKDLVGEPLDLERPSTLQYLPLGDERVLTGVAYTLYRAPDDPLPEGFAGDTDMWHVHDLAKIARASTADRPLLRLLAERRIRAGKVGAGDGRIELTMVHAWIWLDNPDGMFAEEHRSLPYLRAGLPAEWAEGASSEAALGVALLADGTCARETRYTSFLSGADWRQRRDLGSACGESAAEARRGFASRDLDADGLNRLAERAWRDYLSARATILTPEQLARLEVGMEHPVGH